MEQTAILLDSADDNLITSIDNLKLTCIYPLFTCGHTIQYAPYIGIIFLIFYFLYKTPIDDLKLLI